MRFLLSTLALVALVAGCKKDGGDAESTKVPAAEASPVVGISVGKTHSCALTQAGDVVCWGKGLDGTGTDHGPQRIDVGAKATAIASGSSHACALTDAGAARCWGLGEWGRLGYGDGESRVAPGTDVDVGAKITALSAGHGYTCAVTESSALRCWGTGQGGRLGYGNADAIGDDEAPASAGDVDVGGAVRAFAASGHSCAVLDDGSVRCWGFNTQGELGVPMSTGKSVGEKEPASSAPAIDLGGNAVDVQNGGSFSCALIDDGSVRCWGFGASGRTGHGNTDNIGDDEAPSTAGPVDIGGKATQIAVGNSHACALREDGSLVCWGNGARGQLGYGNEDSVGDDEAPASAGAVDVGGKVTEVAAGGDRTCVVLDGGTVRCWGHNRGEGGGGGLGYDRDDDIGDDETPASAGDVPLFP
jgi:alpha-tubulin suppressor-like RCC1 family protein